MRKITIISTKNAKMNTVETAASTWGELREELQGQYDFSSLKAVDGLTKMSYESLDAVLPEGDTRIFLRPTKTKSGATAPDYSAMSFGEIREIIKPNEALKTFLSSYVEGKNWTQLKTDQLRQGVTEFFAAPAETAKEEAAEQAEESTVTEEQAVELNLLDKLILAKEAIAEIADLTAIQHLTEDADDLEEIQGRAEVVLEEIAPLEELLSLYLTPTEGVTGTVADIVQSVAVNKEQEEAERLAREQEEAERRAKEEAEAEEKRRIEAEIKEMNAGFED